MGGVNPPTPDMQDRIVELLRLTTMKKNDFTVRRLMGGMSYKDIVGILQIIKLRLMVSEKE